MEIEAMKERIEELELKLDDRDNQIADIKDWMAEILEYAKTAESMKVEDRVFPSDKDELIIAMENILNIAKEYAERKEYKKFVPLEKPKKKRGRPRKNS
jgi:hypothetical protein